jgi:hypothetical protein
MGRFIGVKMVVATQLTRGQYNEYRGWELPEDENGDDPGFLVEYLDGGESNHPNHEGYISWSPAEVFERAYRPTTGMTFGLALEALKMGQKVARKGWNGKDMWVILTPGRIVEELEPNSFYDKCGFEAPVAINGHIDMRAADGAMVVGWLASQTDMLAEDWHIVD